MKIHIFRTRGESSQILYRKGIDLLISLDITPHVGSRILRPEEAGLLEKNKVLKWDSSIFEWRIGEVRENYLEIGYEKFYLLVLTDETGIARMIKIIPWTKEQEMIIEKKVIPALRSLERSLS